MDDKNDQITFIYILRVLGIKLPILWTNTWLKKGQKIRAGVSPPPFWAMPERIFFLQEVSPNVIQQAKFKQGPYS